MWQPLLATFLKQNVDVEIVQVWQLRTLYTHLPPLPLAWQAKNGIVNILFINVMLDKFSLAGGILYFSLLYINNNNKKLLQRK